MSLVKDLVEMGADPPILLVSRGEIERLDMTRMLSVFLEMMEPEYARALRQRVWLGVDGYDDDPRELIETPEVGEWMRKLDQRWPYWFFFIEPTYSQSLPLLACAVCSFEFVGGSQERSTGSLSPRPSRAFRFTNPHEHAEFMLARFGAMNAICDGLGDTEKVIKQMSNRILSTIGGGAEQIE